MHSTKTTKVFEKYCMDDLKIRIRARSSQLLIAVPNVYITLLELEPPEFASKVSSQFRAQVVLSLL